MRLVLGWRPIVCLWDLGLWGVTSVGVFLRDPSSYLREFPVCTGSVELSRVYLSNKKIYRLWFCETVVLVDLQSRGKLLLIIIKKKVLIIIMIIIHKKCLLTIAGYHGQRTEFAYEINFIYYCKIFLCNCSNTCCIREFYM